MDAQLKAVPRVRACKSEEKNPMLAAARTFAARRLAGGDTQYLRRHTHGALHLEALVLCASDEVGAHCASSQVSASKQPRTRNSVYAPFSRLATFLEVRVMRMR